MSRSRSRALSSCAGPSARARPTASAWSSAIGLAGGLGLDAVLADPRRGHPVAAFGAVAAAAERVAHRDSRLVGTAYAGALAGAVVLAGAGLSRSARTPGQRLLLTGVATWAAVGGTTLRREGRTMARLLDGDDLDGARARLSHLCGRDATVLDAAGLARATVESIAENTSDAIVGPLVWGVVAGVPGLLAYRAVNTLDAMVGHRSDRYARFGWAAARLDDVVNVVPARLTAALTVTLAPLVGGRPRQASRAWRRDGHKHPSPNAGPVEAAFAGALGRTLGGPVSYAGRREDRPLLGDGPAPDVADIARASRLSAAVGLVTGGLAVALRLLR